MDEEVEGEIFVSKTALIKERRIDISKNLYITVWDVIAEHEEDKTILTIFDDEDDAPNFDDIVKLFNKLDVKFKVIKNATEA